MTARCRIVVERLDDVVSLPLDAVLEQEGRTLVRLAGGEERDVVLGARNSDRVVVTEGLAAGERVQLRLLEAPEGGGKAAGAETNGGTADGAGHSGRGGRGGGGGGGRRGR
jgi:multidrug efflux pump subunit AcrA (membrane-fusion protein)